MEKIISKTTIVACKTGDLIFEAGKTPNKLIFPLEGKLTKVKSGTILSEPGQAFGEYYLIKTSDVLDEHVQIDCGPNNSGSYCFITFKDFYEIIGGNPGANIDKVF